mgnify:CR=1 FL=1
MQITDLLVPERVALNMQVADKAMAIHAMVGMLDRTGCLRDAVEYEKNVLEREAQGTTGVGGGVAIPHGKSNAVLVPALAAVTLREAIDYQALDGAPVRLLFLIAAPDGANDLHTRSRLWQKGQRVLVSPKKNSERQSGFGHRFIVPSPFSRTACRWQCTPAHCPPTAGTPTAFRSGW